MATISPWEVLALKSTTLGYSHSVCLRCSNGQQTEDLDNWIISQLPDCSITLSMPLSPLDVELAYIIGAPDEAVTPILTFSTWDALF
jgi:hypothetical protein